MTTLAAIRPDEWNFPLLLHVLGAMLLMGTLSIAAFFLLVPRGDVVAIRRLGWWTLLAGVVPSFLLMRIAAQWIYDRQGFSGDEDPAWIGIGYLTGDLGGLVLLISLIVAGVGARRLRTRGSGGGLMTAAGILSALLVVAYLVAVWAMTVKPD